MGISGSGSGSGALTATESTAALCPMKRKARRVGRKCQTMTAASSEAVTSCFMFGLNATAFTRSRWPRKLRSNAGSGDSIICWVRRGAHVSEPACAARTQCLCGAYAVYGRCA